MNSKEIIRNKFFNQRNNLSKLDVERLSEKINNHLLGCKLFQDAKNIMFYTSIDNEVNLALTMYQAIKEGKKVVLPKVNGSDNTLQLYIVQNPNEDLEIGYAGILEPKSHLFEYDKHNLDLILVPGIAFDPNGNRIGYGKGHFDKLLQHLSVPKIALAYDFQIVQLISAEEHDIKMDYIITEKRLIKC